MELASRIVPALVVGRMRMLQVRPGPPWMIMRQTLGAATCMVAACLSLASCDMSSPADSHSTQTSHGSCIARLYHSRLESPAFYREIKWVSATYAAGSGYGGCGGGVRAQLLYRWTDGNLYQNSWNFHHNYAQAPTEGAVSSPKSLHIECVSTFSCSPVEEY